jgi:uncharacterized protein (DUF1330 family)
MPAYIIMDVDVTDPVVYEEYKKLGPAASAAYGGKFLVRGGPVEVLEGNWMPKRLVIVEFASAEQARAWWSSPEYGPAKEVRQAAAVTQMLLAEGA